MKLPNLYSFYCEFDNKVFFDFLQGSSKVGLFKDFERIFEDFGN